MVPREAQKQECPPSTQPDRDEYILKRHVNCLTVKTEDTESIPRFLGRNLMLGEERLGQSGVRTLLLGNDLQPYIQTVLGQWWLSPSSTADRLAAHTFPRYIF